MGEALGFYGSLVTREMIRTWRGLLLEFGPAELIDTGLLRPFAMGLGIHTLGPGLGIVAGKVVADVAFYLPVVWMYERRQRLHSGGAG